MKRMQVAGHLRRGNPLGASPKTTLDASPALSSPGPRRHAEPTHGKRVADKLCDSSERRQYFQVSESAHE